MEEKEEADSTMAIKSIQIHVNAIVVDVEQNASW